MASGDVSMYVQAYTTTLKDITMSSLTDGYQATIIKETNQELTRISTWLTTNNLFSK